MTDEKNSNADIKSDEYWKDKLTAEEYTICREKGTERPFTGEYWNTTTAGKYNCKCCGETLFYSDAKFDASCGWPSFFQPVQKGLIKEELDTSLGMRRVEIMCQNCGSHLGHVFTDGPEPTGLRYCVNSASITLEADA